MPERCRSKRVRWGLELCSTVRFAATCKNASAAARHALQPQGLHDGFPGFLSREAEAASHLA